MKFWQAVTWAETDQLVEIAKFAEDLGFHGVMTGDHALYPKEMRPDYPYSDTGYPPQTAESAYPDQWAIFGAMAAVTTNLVISALDHVMEYGDQPGIEDSEKAIGNCMDTDALLMSRFMLKRYGHLFKTRNAPVPVVRINWSKA